jgi:SAM-dependent methyltransferase
VLEVGCGTGVFTELFARTGASILAVDISPDLLEKAKQRHLPGGKVRFLTAPFEECDAHGPFDAVVGSSVLHHLEVERSLRKIHALLRPGGIMAFGEPNMLNPQVFAMKNIPWVKRLLGDSPDETAFVRWRLAALLRAVGFTDVRITPIDWLHPRTPRWLIGPVALLGRALEYTPLLREFSGSLLISARRPPGGVARRSAA